MHAYRAASTSVVSVDIHVEAALSRSGSRVDASSDDTTTIGGACAAVVDLTDSDASTMEREPLGLHRRTPSTEGAPSLQLTGSTGSDDGGLGESSKAALEKVGGTSVLKTAGAIFEWVSNAIFDERSLTYRSTSGPVCKIFRGDKLRETMDFRVHSAVQGMRYEVHTYKKIFGRLVFFHKTSTLMGDYAPRAEPYTFTFPQNTIPRLVPGICGEYKAIQMVKVAGEKEPVFLRSAETHIG